MELLLGPQPLVRPVFTQHGCENMEIDDCADGRERAQSVGSSEGADYERKDYVEFKYGRSLDMSKSPVSGDESRLAAGNYRAELKRPDLKGEQAMLLFCGFVPLVVHLPRVGWSMNAPFDFDCRVGRRRNF
ncbi:unnamed protein product [Heligmosomoides polygyrus]|uniref:Uncharacterized protein n=1 Tax=Heligmosomoides polygyrus TaxID=6339 RepID=A0A183GV68_HELPZ|nr:unnamed protein product [Heligmosomoides polygyrus]